MLGRAPQVVEFENVTGLLSKNNGADFASLCQGLVSAGYHVGAVVMNALQFVPQNRERVFIVAVRAGCRYPEGTDGDPSQPSLAPSDASACLQGSAH